MSNTRWTREQLAAKGYHPDCGGVVRLPPDEWDSKHGRTHSEGEVRKPAIRVPRRHLPNKTEARWLLSAKARWPSLTILYEPLTFRLPSGCGYTPDFVAFHGSTIAWAAECKGEHIHSARSVHAWKEAAAAFPSWPWIFAQRRGGEWCETEVVPNDKAETQT